MFASQHNTSRYSSIESLEGRRMMSAAIGPNQSLEPTSSDTTAVRMTLTGSSHVTIERTSEALSAVQAIDQVVTNS